MLFEESRGVWRVDLEWMGLPGQMAAYLVEAGDAFAVVESGPGSTLPRLLEAVRALGREPGDVTHVLVTHVHLDHAGAAGALLREAPRAKLYAHPRAAPHLLDPGRLLGSARRIYGDLMDRLWGEMLPVPADRLVVVQDGGEVRIGGRVLRAVDTPGHARHHHAFHDPGSGVLFAGDVGGIRLGGGLPYVSVPTPPPDVDLEAWRGSIARLRALGPTRILPTHFGGTDDVEWHLDDLDARIARLAEWSPLQAAITPDAPGFTAAMRERGNAEILAATGSEDAVRAYEQAVPYEMMAAGLLRWLSVQSG